MGSEVEITETPNWLKELEAKREKRLKVKLGHELGAGAPCLTCEGKCPGLDLHFWRKICKNCKCSKENHEVQDDDIYGWAQEELLGIKSNRFKRKIVLPGAKEEVELEWTPSGPKETIDRYLKTMPPELLPIKGTQAAQDRKQLLKKQIPIHDIDPFLCHDLTNEELEKMQEYICHVKQCSVGVGHLIQISANKGTTHVLDENNAMFLINNVPKSIADSHSVILEEEQNSSPLKNLDSNLRNTNRLGFPHVKSAISVAKPSFFDIQTNSRANDALPTNDPQFLHKKIEYPHGEHFNLNEIQSNPALQSRNLMPSKFVAKHSSENIEDAVKLLNLNPNLSNISTEYQNPTSMPPMRDVQYSANYTGKQSMYGSEKPLENMLNKLNQNSEYQSQINKIDPLRSHIIKEGTGGIYQNAELSNINSHPSLSKSLETQPNESRSLANNANLSRTNIPLPYFTPGNANFNEDTREPTHFKNIKDFAYSTYDNSSTGGHGDDSPEFDTHGGSINASLKADNAPLKGNFPHSPIEEQKIVNMTNKSGSTVANTPYAEQQMSSTLVPNQKLGTGNFRNPNSRLNKDHDNNYASEMMPKGVFSSPNVGKSGDILEYIPQGKNIQEEELEPTYVPIDGIRDIMYEENPEIRVALSKNQFFEESLPNKFLPSLTTSNLPSCHFCKEIMNPNELAISIPERSDAVFHTDCFKCHGCNQILADMFYFYDKGTENIYCGRDYAKIRGIPRCKACDELIFVKEYCLAEYSTFHVKHFCCFECDKPLAGQNYVMENDQPMCVPCFELLKANKCYACKDVIHPDQQGLQLKDGVHFHASEDCFACRVCKKSLFDAKLLFRSDRLYCSHDCYNSDV